MIGTVIILDFLVLGQYYGRSPGSSDGPCVVGSVQFFLLQPVTCGMRSTRGVCMPKSWLTAGFAISPWPVSRGGREGGRGRS